MSQDMRAVLAVGFFFEGKSEDAVRAMHAVD
jgi:hypothetical protein